MCSRFRDRTRRYFKSIRLRRLAHDCVFRGLGHEFESTERIYRDIMAVRGKAKVYFPLPAYDYAQTSVYSYARFAKTSVGVATKRLLEMAKSVGGSGVVMECVDYRNYTPEVCAATGEFQKQR